MGGAKHEAKDDWAGSGPRGGTYLGDEVPYPGGGLDGLWYFSVMAVACCRLG